MSVRLSVRMEQLGSHLTYFHEILYFSIFRKSVDKNFHEVLYFSIFRKSVDKNSSFIKF